MRCLGKLVDYQRFSASIYRTNFVWLLSHRFLMSEYLQFSVLKHPDGNKGLIFMNFQMGVKINILQSSVR